MRKISSSLGSEEANWLTQLLNLIISALSSRHLFHTLGVFGLLGRLESFRRSWGSDSDLCCGGRGKSHRHQDFAGKVSYFLLLVTQPQHHSILPKLHIVRYWTQSWFHRLRHSIWISQPSVAFVGMCHVFIHYLQYLT